MLGYLFVGILIGTGIGIFVMCLMQIASESDKYMESIMDEWERREESESHD